MFMNKGSKSSLVSKTGAVALALSFAAGNATEALAACAGPQEMTALRVAALRQHLMVAALACHEAPSFNQFVTSYQSEFLDSDHVLIKFFKRQGSGESGYNAYKTREANDSSLRSLSDPRFCGAAEEAFYIALHRNLSLSELATEEAALVHTGYASCTRSADAADDSYGSPQLPAPHGALMEMATAAPAAAPSIAAPVASPAPARVAAIPPAADAVYDPPQQDDAAVANDAPPPQQAASNYYPYQARDGYQTAYRAPYNPYYSNAWYPQNPPQMRQVMGPDGNWYLVPSYR
jgi:hypothetical protein